MALVCIQDKCFFFSNSVLYNFINTITNCRLYIESLYSSHRKTLLQSLTIKSCLFTFLKRILFYRIKGYYIQYSNKGFNIMEMPSLLRQQLGIRKNYNLFCLSFVIKVRNIYRIDIYQIYQIIFIIRKSVKRCAKSFMLNLDYWEFLFSYIL